MVVIFSKKLDFGGTGTPVAPGYTRGTTAAYTAARKFGWVGSGLTLLATGFTDDPLTADCVRGNDAEFHLDVPNGIYTVTLTRVDPRQKPDRVTVSVNEVVGPTSEPTQQIEIETITDVTVTDGKLKIKLVSDGLTASYFGLAALEVEGVDVPVPPPPPPADLPDLPGIVTGSATAVPSLTHRRDRTPYLQGAFFVRFTASTQGTLGEAIPPSTVNTPGAYALGLDVGGVAAEAGLALVGGAIVNNMVRADAAALGSPHTLCVTWDAYWMWLYLDGRLVAEGNKGREPNPPQITESDYFQGLAPDSLLTTELHNVSHVLLADEPWSALDVEVAHLWAGGVVPPPPAPLTVDAGSDITTNEHLVTFNPTISGGIPPYNQIWDYGDGTLGPDNTHRYEANGTYTASLTVSDRSDEPYAEDEVQVTVQHVHPDDPVPPPVERFYFTRHKDRLPDYCFQPTLSSVKDGDALDPATWGGRLPGPNDDAVFGHKITIAGALTLRNWKVPPRGSLEALAGTDFRFLTGQVHEGGTFGALGQPDKPTTLTILNKPIDTAYDPEQWGHGLNVTGTFTVKGSWRTPFVEVAGDLLTGQDTMKLAQAADGWRVGDRLVIPDTRQLDYSNGADRGVGYEWQGETATIKAVSADGKTITLAGPLKFDHKAFRGRGNWVLDYLISQSRFGILGYDSPDLRPIQFPFHVMNLTRDVVIKSESGSGVRGHIAWLDMATVDVSGAEFRSLGRTTNDPIDNTTFDGAGAVIHVGTNQWGRYPCHNHHCHSKPKIVGSSSHCGMPDHKFKWGLVLHGTSDAVVTDNAIYNWAGSGINTEDGTERRNVIERNMVCRVRAPYGNSFTNGTGADLGGCFWLVHSDNVVRDNVAANCFGQDAAGFYWYQKQLGALADPVLNFSGNKVYGATAHGLSVWNLGIDGATAEPLPNQPQSVFKDFFAANCHGVGFYPYNVNRLLFDGFVVRGDPTGAQNTAYNGGSDYLAKDVTFRNFDMQGVTVGGSPGAKTNGDTVWEDGWFSDLGRDAVSIVSLATSTPDSTESLKPRRTILRNVCYGPSVPLKLALSWGFYHCHLLQRDEIYLYQHGGDPAKNFRAYYREQAPDVVMRDSVNDGVTRVIASPESGLTNVQIKGKYNVEPAGKVAPATTVDGLAEGVDGLLEPIPAEVTT